MNDLRKDCKMRHENGNCNVIGGFCTAVNDSICAGLHNAYDCGYYDGEIRAKREQGQIVRWISVEDKLPDVGQRVLCIDEAGTVHMATGWIDWPDKTVYFCVPDLHRWLQSSYWLPLPEAPEKRPGTECCPNQNIEPAWKRQFLRTFLGGR